jgi:cytochrome c556
MKLSLAIGTAALAFFAATAFAQGAAPLDVRREMQQHVNPAMLSIWDVTNNAVGDDGGIDAAQMDDEKWAQVAAGADRLSIAGQDMALASAYLAAAPGNTEVGDGETPMAKIQGYLDADPKGFAEAARGLADHAERLASAARSKDAVTAGALVSEMDAVCESCHATYWYPES